MRTELLNASKHDSWRNGTRINFRLIAMRHPNFGIGCFINFSQRWVLPGETKNFASMYKQGEMNESLLWHMLKT
ncbi:hypothetical protein PHMEG_00025167 [Phytophthora megakarya]|uniref:Uncharacterized protein n=1 Tax=Phytophthora megakarya TaxID=4795 RepID=A0A225VCU3_9STRA|nr:hypothetical protein PHMEG_00025167 [Phytophthora megakarya]